MDSNSDRNSQNEWASAEVAHLSAPAGWEPNVDAALRAVRQRARDQSMKRRAWTWAGVSAVAATLLLMAFPTLRAGTGLAWQRVTGQTPVSTIAGTSGQQPVAPVFDESNMLGYPSDYRNWVYVGTSLGLSYSEVAEEAGDRPEFFQNVYIDPRAYDSYRATGEFPEGTMMVLEVASQEEKNEPGLQGRYQKEILGIEASVKDNSRFDGGWAYFSFTERSGERKQVAGAFPEESCWTCHDDHAETDHVFTQFYPVLSLLLF